MTKNTNKQSGYSLLELVIYIALFASISVVIVHSLLNAMRTYASEQAYRRLQSNGELIMERITRETRQADTINSTGSSFGVNPGALSISGTDIGGVSHNIVFSVVSGAVQISDNSVVGNLSNPEVIVTSLIFRRITTPIVDGVKVELVLQTANKRIISAPFYGTVMLRGD